MRGGRRRVTDLSAVSSMTLDLCRNFAEALYNDVRASRADILQGVALLEDVARVRRRVFGTRHPDTVETLASLERARTRREDALRVRVKK